MSTENGTTTQTEKATFGAGCFWQVEEAFRKLDGVIDTVVGYEGGHVDNPTYEQVCTGNTGHVEVVQVTFDPAKVRYEELVEKYFDIHDPTQLNRQGPDVGSQYRSAIFPNNPDQAAIAQAYVEQLNQARVFRGAVVTRIEPGASFYEAEPYHQDFLTRHPDHPYIVVNDLPKVKDLQKLFPDLYRAHPVLVGFDR